MAAKWLKKFRPQMCGFKNGVEGKVRWERAINGSPSASLTLSPSFRLLDCARISFWYGVRGRVSFARPRTYSMIWGRRIELILNVADILIFKNRNRVDANNEQEIDYQPHIWRQWKTSVRESSMLSHYFYQQIQIRRKNFKVKLPSQKNIHI